MLKLVINALLFQAGWILSVLYGNGVAILIAISAVAIYGFFYLRNKAELMLIVSIITLGALGDTLLGYFGVLVYPSGAPYPPFWMVTLWLLFATTIPWSLHWLAGKRLWFVLFSIIGGPFSYYVGVSLTGVTFGLGIFFSIAVLGILWMMYGLIIQYFFSRWQNQVASI